MTNLKTRKTVTCLLIALAPLAARAEGVSVVPVCVSTSADSGCDYSASLASALQGGLSAAGFEVVTLEPARIEVENYEQIPGEAADLVAAARAAEATSLVVIAPVDSESDLQAREADGVFAMHGIVFCGGDRLECTAMTRGISLSQVAADYSGSVDGEIYEVERVRYCRAENKPADNPKNFRCPSFEKPWPLESTNWQQL